MKAKYYIQGICTGKSNVIKYKSKYQRGEKINC